MLGDKAASETVLLKQVTMEDICKGTISMLIVFVSEKIMVN